MTQYNCIDSHVVSSYVWQIFVNKAKSLTVFIQKGCEHPQSVRIQSTLHLKGKTMKNLPCTNAHGQMHLYSSGLEMIHSIEMAFEKVQYKRDAVLLSIAVPNLST